MEPVRESVGRRYPEKFPILVGDPFMNDFMKIVQCKASRRLARKTQVMCDPANPHVRTRLLHTQEVMYVAHSIAEKLGLNTNLCMAIAAGHDIGHGPYGHSFESAAKKLDRNFLHNVNSVVVAQHVEWKGEGLNLHLETLEGILHHARGKREMVVDPSLHQEYNVVMYADKIAYTMSDLNDAIRYGILKDDPALAKKFGCEQMERNNKCIRALVEESLEKGYVSFEESAVAKDFAELRRFMYDHVYSKIDQQSQMHVLLGIYDAFKFEPAFEGIDPLLVMSLLTDEEAFNARNVIFQRGQWDISRCPDLGVLEIVKYLKDRNIDCNNPDLDWKEDAIKD
jgi:dGTPase